ncbi:MAG: DUF814 domain-containing protein [Candidatus Eremiobacteraeota bacterium]|nr:DUF814 domain-containing protein [Candidatus Eremiobacteraeota bacterium]
MLTDWVLIRRLALELRETLGGMRIVDAGILADGRPALRVRRGNRDAILAFDCFAPTPLVTLEDNAEVRPAPGFGRALADALDGKRVVSASSRRGDRLVRLECAARSRFGVTSGYALVAELVPKFGNLLLLKDETVVAALKEFDGGKTARRVMAGETYEPPPLPAMRVPRLLAQAGIEAGRLDELVDTMKTGDALHAYYDGATLLQVHVVPLPQFASYRHESEAALLPLLSALREERDAETLVKDVHLRRAAVARRLTAAFEKTRAELREIDAQLERAGARDAFRLEGEAILATLHESPAHERAEAKKRAAAAFARYRKLGTSQAHLVERRAVVQSRLVAIEELEWELERSDDGGAEVAEAIDAFTSRKARPRPKHVKRPRLEYVTPAGSRILVGRSPLENAEMTFRVARPDDLWFHARQMPGAHVILQRDDRAAPPPEDLETAAAVAAWYSKGRSGGAVAVDYALRKFVRKQPDAPPGLVFYTNFATINVVPRDVFPVTRS